MPNIVDNVYISAGAVVIKDIPENSIVAGAQHILNQELIQ